jgi:hypothetical protein
MEPKDIFELTPKNLKECICELERAATRERLRKEDWERYFRHRMSYADYRLRNYLNTSVFMGRMGPEMALEIFRNFKESESAVLTDVT